MHTKILFAGLILAMAFAGCKKSTDNASQWVGTYTAASGGGVTNAYVNQVVVQESNSYTLRMAFNNSSGSNLVTYVTLQKVTLQNATSGTISEGDITLGVTDTVHYSGTVALISGDTLKILCNGVDSGGTTPFNFYGAKQ